MQRAVVVAVDGPSGSGKSSVSRAVASRLGLAYLDTGSMYRALCLACQRAGIDLDDRDAVAAFTAGVGLAPGTDPSAPSISIVTGGEPDAEVSEAIRDPAVSAAVSAVATNLAVRARLKTEQQQIIAEARRRGRGIVVEGRDITTVVAPDASWSAPSATPRTPVASWGSLLAKVAAPVADWCKPAANAGIPSASWSTPPANCVAPGTNWLSPPDN